MTVSNGDYIITTDKDRLDIDFIHSFLTSSYWAEGISGKVVARSTEGSLCFGVFLNNPPTPAASAGKPTTPASAGKPIAPASAGKQVGFARMITDQATFAYLADVFIDEDHRGKGLSKWLMKVILSHAGLQGLRRIMLATRDAHALYAQLGFTPINNPERWMQMHNPEVYKH
jgi:GNAT superfamily N-acetyltransferase